MRRRRQGMGPTPDAEKDCFGSDLEDNRKVVSVEVGGRWCLHPEYRDALRNMQRSPDSFCSGSFRRAHDFDSLEFVWPWQ